MSYRQRGRSYCQRGNNRQLSYSRQMTTHPKLEPLHGRKHSASKWDDSVGLTAFHEAKQRFWEIYHGFPCENKLPSNAADLYIDDVDWNSEIDRELFSETKSLTDDEDGEKDNAKEMDWFSSLLEEIQAIGWDEFEEAAPACLAYLDHRRIKSQ
ncbi:hypothetical protein GOBAR_AA38413 [Gossypium barbadense]|uniref:Uncharacterized protein n=1 Tax=Gossypium barbadense TaxID=3634 RepID=A0A2P5VTY7_GOSBA|nr:hypothetical protein GOBAR_DD32291 [Gossypium barbadense]PPR82299.1 hypothetical protein GOBAR_AA38413 [Gossypium barbadense]